MGLKRQTDELHYKLIVEALEATEGDITATAERLKVPRRTLYNMMKKLDIDPDDYRFIYVYED